MDMSIRKYADKPTMKTASQLSDQSRFLITSIPPALPKACEMPSSTNIHSSKTMRVRLNSSKENLTHLKGNYVHFFLADCEFITPVRQLLVDLGVINPQDHILSYNYTASFSKH